MEFKAMPTEGTKEKLEEFTIPRGLVILAWTFELQTYAEVEKSCV